MNVGLRLILLLLCLIAGGFFAGMETGVIAINRLRLRHLVRHRVPGAALLEGFLRRPDRLLSTTLTGTNLCYVMASIWAASLGMYLWPAGGAAVAGGLVTLFILVGCEYLPKSWFSAFPARRTLPFARGLRFFSWAFRPVTWFITHTVALVLPKAEVRAQAKPFLTREELIHLTQEGERTGTLTPEETRMIHSVFELSGKSCGEVMQPRSAMVCVEQTMSVEELIAFAREKSFTRYPVWNRETQSFTGIVNLFEVLADEHPEGKTVQAYLRHPQFVEATVVVDHVMPRMRVTRQPMVLVTNDRFEVVGLITIEDVLEEIVGRL